MTPSSPVLEITAHFRGGNRAAAVAGIASLLAVEEAGIGDDWLQVANLALVLGELRLAEQCALRFLEKGKNQLQRVVVCAGVHAEAGNFEAALEFIRPLLQDHPADPSLNHLCGTVYQQLGERKLAEEHLLLTLDSAELAGAAWLTLAAQHRFTDADPLLDRLQGLEQRMRRTDPGNRLQYHYALGKALLDVRDFDAAFDAFEAGAQLAPGRNRYDPLREQQRLRATMAHNDAESMGGLAAAGNIESRAIFVVGLPRSGTTLLHRILEGHSAIDAGGEFAGMGVATMDMNREGLGSAAALVQSADAGSARLRETAAVYRHLVDERFGANAFVVDKSIGNSWRIGAIASVFPDAPIVIIERDILDVAWSCFRTCFSKGQHWSWSLADIAAHFRIERQLLEHWRSVLPERLVTLRYEDLVREPESEVRRIAAACALEFEPAMLDFHTRKAPVTTASVAQVTEPLSETSVGAAASVSHRMKKFVEAFDA